MISSFNQAIVFLPITIIIDKLTSAHCLLSVFASIETFDIMILIPCYSRSIRVSYFSKKKKKISWSNYGRPIRYQLDHSHLFSSSGSSDSSSFKRYQSINISLILYNSDQPATCLRGTEAPDLLYIRGYDIVIKNPINAMRIRTCALYNIYTLRRVAASPA